MTHDADDSSVRESVQVQASSKDGGREPAAAITRRSALASVAGFAAASMTVEFSSVSAQGSENDKDYPFPMPANPLRNYFLGPPGSHQAVGAANIGLGEATLRSLTSGYNNTAIGDQALWQHETGINCVAVGAHALFDSLSCIDCTAVGTGALAYARGGVGATAVGRLSCNKMTEANNNSGFGDSALRFTTTGYANVAVGYRAAEGNETGSSNVVMGAHAALGKKSGDRNVVVGGRAMWKANRPCNDVVAVGAHALRVYAGDGNTAVGSYAGGRVAEGRDNVFVGRNAGRQRRQKRNPVNTVAIGADTFTTENNQVVIGNRKTQTVVLAGVRITKGQLRALLDLIVDRGDESVLSSPRKSRRAAVRERHRIE